MDNNFFLNLIATLQKTRSKQQIQTDTKSLGDIYVKLIGNLNISKTRAAIKNQLKGINNLTFNISPTVNTKGVQTATRQAINNAQKISSSNKVHLNFDTNKQQLVNQIKILGQSNNKLFNNRDMAAKYNQLLNSANAAKSVGEIKTLRGELSAFKTELVATNNAGMTWGSKFKESIKSFAQFFGGASFIYALSNQLREAWTEAVELDKSYTDLIKVQSELTRGDYPAYLEQCNKKAQELATTQKSLIEGATEFSKSGYTKTQSDQLAMKSVILSNVGDMSASDSAKAIISGVQAYDVIDGYDNVIDKAGALIDKFNEVGNTASITTAEIAQGVQTVGSVFSDANTSVDQFIALLSAGNRQFQNADTLALGLRTAALRIRGCKAELEKLGETTEDVYTSSSKLAAKIEGLTNVDGNGGVQILEADGKTFRSIYDIFVDISKVYQKMSDTDQSALLDLIAGKNRASAISATLNNMSEAQEIYERSLHSAGSAQKEYDTYLESSEASLNRFKSNLTETYQSIINGNTVRDLANLGSAVLSFANSFGIIEGTLKGIVAIGLGKFITTGTMAFVSATKQVEQYGRALQMANNVPNGNLAARYQALKSIAQATSNLTTTQLKNVLANKALTQQDRVMILQMKGITKEAALQKLAEMNLTQATNAQTAANAAQTASTFSLKAAMMGLGATIKSVFLSNPVGIALMAISLGVSAITSAVSNHNQKMEEMRQKTSQAFEDTLSEIESLNNELKTTIDRIKELERLENSGKISIAEKDELELLKKKNKELERQIVLKKQQKVEEANDVLKDLGNANLDVRSNYKRNYNTVGRAPEMAIISRTEEASYATEEYNDLLKERNDLLDQPATQWNTNRISSIDKELASLGKYIDSLYDEDVQNKISAYESLINEGIKLNTTQQADYDALKSLENEYLMYCYRIQETEEAYKTLNAEQKKSILLDKLKEKGYTENQIEAIGEHLKENNLDNYYTADFNFTLPNIDEYNGDIEKWADDFVTAWVRHVDEKSTSVDKGNIISVSDYLNQSELADTKKKLLDLAKSGEITEETLTSTEEYAKILSTLGISAEDAKTQILNMLGATDKLSAANAGMDKLTNAYKEFKDKRFVLAETLSALPTVFKNLDGYNAFEKIVGDPTSGAEKIQQAFNDIATEYITTQATLAGLSEENMHRYIANLTDMGVTNAEEVVRNYLSTYSESEKLVVDLTKKAYNAYLKYLESKSSSDLEYFNSLVSNNSDLAKALGETYKSDYKNWTKLLQQKANAYNSFVNAIKGSQVGIGSATAAMSDQGIAKKQAEEIVTNASMYGTKNGKPTSPLDYALGKNNNSNAKYTQSQVDKAKEYLASIEKYDELQKKLSIDLSTINTDFGGSFSFSGSKDGSSSEKDSKKTYDWIEKALTRIKEAYDRLNKVVSATYRSWSTRNNALAQEIGNVRDQISLNQKAYEGYMAQADSVGLSDYYKTLVQNGAISIEDITDKDLQEQIENYQTWFEKAIACSDAITELQDNLADLAKTQFDNTAKQFDERISLIEHETDMLNGTITIIENRGYLASAKLYDSLIQNESKKLSELQSKYASLSNEIKGVEEGTEMWYDMYEQILSVEKEIQDSTNSMVEFNNKIRELQWDVFDKLQERMSAVTDEAEFFIDLMSNNKLFTDEGITDFGRATFGLHAVNLNTYMAQADEYAKELKQINEDLADDPNNLTLLERRKELIDAQREMIKNAEQEKQSIKDLVSDGYDVMLDALQKLVDKHKSLNEQIRDQYDYEKTIKDQVAEVTKYQKILDSLSGDTSEQNQSALQKYREQLQEAKDTLQETEMEKAMDEAEKYLDSMMDSAEEWVNERLDNLDELINNVISNVNDDSKIIKDTLTEEATRVGTTLSDEMESIWSPNGTFTSIVTTYANGFDNKMTTVSETLNGIKDLIASMVKDAEEKANEQHAKDTSAGGATPSTPAPSTPGTNAGGSGDGSNGAGSSNGSGGSGGSNGDWGSWFIHKVDSFPKGSLNTETSIVDRLKYRNIDSAFSARAGYYAAMGGSGSYVGSASQNRWMISQMKQHGYKVGSRNIPYDQNNWIHEGEIVYRPADGAMMVPLQAGGTVFTKEQVGKLWDMSKNNLPLSGMQKLDFDVPAASKNQTINVGDVEYNITLEGIDDAYKFAEQFKQIFDKDIGNIRKMIDTSVNGKFGSMEYRKFLK